MVPGDEGVMQQIQRGPLALNFQHDGDGLSHYTLFRWTGAGSPRVLLSFWIDRDGACAYGSTIELFPGVTYAKILYRAARAGWWK